jgi:hypothetical protein
MKGMFTLTYDTETNVAAHMTNMNLAIVQQLLQQIIIEEGVKNAQQGGA